MIIKCEQCGELFEHIQPHRVSKGKRFCDYCRNKRDKEKNRLNYWKRRSK